MALHQSGRTTWEDSLGDFGIERAKWQYVLGFIEVEEFEDRVWTALHVPPIERHAPRDLLEANLRRLWHGPIADLAEAPIPLVES